MKILGINALNHDAAITLIDSDNGKILFAAHAERYSGIKNDSNPVSYTHLTLPTTSRV